MSNSENYQKFAARNLENVLRDCHWCQIKEGLWKLGRTQLLVDDIGIFFFQLEKNLWKRTAGLIHDYITKIDLKAQVIHFLDGRSLDLTTGEI